MNSAFSRVFEWRTWRGRWKEGRIGKAGGGPWEEVVMERKMLYYQWERAGEERKKGRGGEEGERTGEEEIKGGAKGNFNEDHTKSICLSTSKSRNEQSSILAEKRGKEKGGEQEGQIRLG